MKEGLKKKNDDGSDLIIIDEQPHINRICWPGDQPFYMNINTMYVRCVRCNKKSLKSACTYEVYIYDVIVPHTKEVISVCNPCFNNYNMCDRFLQAQYFRRCCCLVGEVREESMCVLACLPPEIARMIAMYVIMPLWTIKKEEPLPGPFSSILSTERLGPDDQIGPLVMTTENTLEDVD